MGFTQINNEILRRGDINPSAKVILLIIASHEPDYPLTVEQISKEAAVSRDTVRRQIKELKQMELLSWVDIKTPKGLMHKYKLAPLILRHRYPAKSAIKNTNKKSKKVINQLGINDVSKEALVKLREAAL